MDISKIMQNIPINFASKFWSTLIVIYSFHFSSLNICFLTTFYFSLFDFILSIFFYLMFCVTIFSLLYYIARPNCVVLYIYIYILYIYICIYIYIYIYIYIIYSANSSGVVRGGKKKKKSKLKLNRFILALTAFELNIHKQCFYFFYWHPFGSFFHWVLVIFCMKNLNILTAEEKKLIKHNIFNFSLKYKTLVLANFDIQSGCGILKNSVSKKKKKLPVSAQDLMQALLDIQDKDYTYTHKHFIYICIY